MSLLVFFDEADRRALAMAGILIVAIIVGACSIGLALGLALRIFLEVSGW